MIQRASKCQVKTIIQDNSASVVGINSREDGVLPFLCLPPPFIFLRRLNSVTPSHSAHQLHQQSSFAAARAWSHIFADQTTVSPIWARVPAHFKHKQSLRNLYSGSYAQCSLISLPSSGQLSPKDSAEFSFMALVVICPALCGSEVCSYLARYVFPQWDFWSFIFCSSKTLCGYPEACFVELNSAVLTAAPVRHKSQDFESLPQMLTILFNVDSLTATCWTEQKACLRFQSRFFQGSLFPVISVFNRRENFSLWNSYGKVVGIQMMIN